MPTRGEDSRNPRESPLRICERRGVACEREEMTTVLLVREKRIAKKLRCVEARRRAPIVLLLLCLLEHMGRLVREVSEAIGGRNRKQGWMDVEVGWVRGPREGFGRIAERECPKIHRDMEERSILLQRGRGNPTAAIGSPAAGGRRVGSPRSGSVTPDTRPDSTALRSRSRH